MLKTKACLCRRADMIAEYERVLLNDNASSQEKDRAEDGIEAIMRLYASDPNVMTFLILKIEELFQKYLTK